MKVPGWLRNVWNKITNNEQKEEAKLEIQHIINVEQHQINLRQTLHSIFFVKVLADIVFEYADDSFTQDYIQTQWLKWWLNEGKQTKAIVFSYASSLLVVKDPLLFNYLGDATRVCCVRIEAEENKGCVRWHQIEELVTSQCIGSTLVPNFRAVRLLGNYKGLAVVTIPLR